MTTTRGKARALFGALVAEGVALRDSRRRAAERELMKVRTALAASQAEAQAAWEALGTAQRLKEEISDPATQAVANPGTAVPDRSRALLGAAEGRTMMPADRKDQR